MAGWEIELADDPVALGPRLNTLEFDAVRQHDLLAARKAPEEIKMPPGAPVLAVGRELQPDLLLFPDDVFDIAVIERGELGGRDRVLLALGARRLDRIAAQDGADMIGPERRLFSLHGDALRTEA